MTNASGVLLLLFVALPHSVAWFYGRAEPDAWSQGEVWPQPQFIEFHALNRSLTPGQILFTAGQHEDCDIVQDNVRVYMERWLFPFPVLATSSAPAYPVSIRIETPCPRGAPQQDMDETYTLKVSSEKTVIEAAEVWGAVRALETFSQLIFFDQKTNTYKLRTALVRDSPRFSVRGILLDTSRHFLSVKTIKRQLDLMAANKLNVLHWHIVDDESFPYESMRYPHLSKKGAYSPRHVYTRAAVQEIVEYARIRGIRVLPEFDTPGHTSSWRAQPGFLSECFDADGASTGLPNLVDPSEETNFDFLTHFFDELVSTFPERFLHLGGDEVADYITECWERNPKISAFMERMEMGNDTSLLETYYFKRIEKIVRNLRERRDAVFWQEVFDNNEPMTSSIVHIWKGNTLEEMHENIKNATARGHRVIVSACWYLNYVKYGADWKSEIRGQLETNYKYYYCDPTDFDGTAEQKALVLGGIATMWGEMIDNTNIEAVLWPRASAVAERLWSTSVAASDADVAWPRLHELRCRLVARGYRVSPTNWPDFCPYEFDA